MNNLYPAEIPGGALFSPKALDNINKKGYNEKWSIFLPIM